MICKAPAFWQKKHSWQKTLLSPLGQVWSLGGMCHRHMSQAKSITVPVVSIGNISMGGAGKTPLVSYLASHFPESAIITRGYGKKRQPAPLCVDPAHHTALDVGDEPLLVSKIASTWVSADRYQGALHATAQGAKLIFLDDGHQNYTLYKDISLLVVDGRLGWGNGNVFPAGPLRESMTSALKRCSALVIIGPDTWGIEAVVKERVPVFKATLETTFCRKDVSKPYAAFAGIAYPQKFLDLLHHLGITPMPFLTYPDHHIFTHENLKLLNTLATHYTLLTTEKDWVRLPVSLQQKVTFVPIALTFNESHNIITFLKTTLSNIKEKI